MFPCEMARYIAGFSREARKYGPFCRLPSPGAKSADPSADPGVRSSNLPRRANRAQRLASRCEYCEGRERDCKTSEAPPNRLGGVLSWSLGCSLGRGNYLSEVLISPNLVLRLLRY